MSKIVKSRPIWINPKGFAHFNNSYLGGGCVIELQLILQNHLQVPNPNKSPKVQILTYYPRPITSTQVASLGTCQRLRCFVSKTVGTVLLSRSHQGNLHYTVHWHQVQKCDWGARARCKHLPPTACNIYLTTLGNNKNFLRQW